MRLGVLSSLAITVGVASVAVAQPQAETLQPAWPSRAFEAELAGKGVVLELPGDPTAYRSVQVGAFRDGGDELWHKRLLMAELGEAAKDIDIHSIEPEGNNSLVFLAPADAEDAQPEGGVQTLLFASLRDTQPYELDRTWMAYEPATTEGVVGLAVIIPGTFGYPPELYEKWSLDLRDRGWSVLRLLSQPARFTERIVYEIEGGQGTRIGAEFASHADDRTAECAYAVESGAKWAESKDPRLASKPRAILGFSGGAILAPAVVAREPERYRTVALVAGGANAASISIDSTFMKQFIRSVEIRFTSGNRERSRAQFEASYLENATLDAYHAATSFGNGTRVLVLDGSFDKAVPFESSTLMFERLDAAGLEPIRRTYPSNHVMLFMALAEMMDEVNAWLDGGELALPPGQEAQNQAAEQAKEADRAP